MKILFVSLGSDGDILPFLRIACILKHEGHDVIFFTQESAEAWIRNHGFEFESIVTLKEVEKAHEFVFGNHADRIRLKPFWDLILKKSTTRLLEKMETHFVPNETVMIAPTRHHAARITQEVFQMPLISVNITPNCFDLDVTEADAILLDDIEEIRISYGLKPLTQTITEWGYSPEMVMTLFPRWFHPPKDHWPPNVTQLQFLVDVPGMAPLSPEMNSFLEKNEKPIVFIYGTFNETGIEFLRFALRVCDQMGKAGIVLGWKFPLPEDLPDHLYVHSWSSLPELLPKASVFVHHGGLGTLAEGIRAGIPQLALPNSGQQESLGERLEALELGRSIHLESIGSVDVASVIQKMMDDPKIAKSCKVHSELMSRARPWRSAAKKIIEFAQDFQAKPRKPAPTRVKD